MSVQQDTRISVCLCVRVLSEVSSAGRNSHPARSKQRPLVMLDPGVWVTGRLSRGERKPGESKITLLCPDMTVNWTQGFWVSRLPRPRNITVLGRTKWPCGDSAKKIKLQNKSLEIKHILCLFFLPVCTTGLQTTFISLLIISSRTVS